MEVVGGTSGTVGGRIREIEIERGLNLAEQDRKNGRLPWEWSSDGLIVVVGLLGDTS